MRSRSTTSSGVAGGLASWSASPGAQETLNRYVAETWAKTHAVTLAPKTAKHYASLYDLHIEPYLGELKLTELTPEVIARWQADRVADGAGRVAVLQALDLLGGILQRAVEGGRLGAQPGPAGAEDRAAAAQGGQAAGPGDRRGDARRGRRRATRRCSRCWPTRGCGRRRRSRCSGATCASARC